MNICLHFSWVIAGVGWLGHMVGLCLILERSWATFLEWWYHFMLPSALRETSRGSISSPTLGSLCQKSYNVLYKTQTSQHFPTIQVKHIKCLHENSKLMFSHRKLPTLLLHHQSPTLLLCVPQACGGFLRMSETQSLCLMILKSYCCVWHITQVFHTDV